MLSSSFRAFFLNFLGILTLDILSDSWYIIMRISCREAKDRNGKKSEDKVKKYGGKQ